MRWSPVFPPLVPLSRPVGNAAGGRGRAPDVRQAVLLFAGGDVVSARALRASVGSPAGFRIEFVKDLGGINPVWAFSESPLVDGDKLVGTPGAEDGTLMALDKKTGKPLWKCKVPEGPTGDRGFLGTSGAAYSSVIAIDFDGVRQYMQLTATTLVGVSTDGKLLWRYDRASNTHRINCSMPVYADGVVFAASSYDAGGGRRELEQGRHRWRRWRRVGRARRGGTPTG